MTDTKNNNRLLSAIIRQDFSSFIHKVFSTINPGTEFLPNWHIDLIADYLEMARTGKKKRLIINMPPRALKSVCVSVAWPAWLLAKNPATRIIAASYAQSLSVKHSMDCRFILSSNWYKKLFHDTKLSKHHNQKSKFMTIQNGFRFATSVGGSVTGEGGDVLIIDDPHKPSQIHSNKWRQKTCDWFDNTFSSRLNDQNNGVIVLVMQRLHEEDLTNHLMQNGSWDLLKIPAIASDDIYYKALGTTLQGKTYHFPKDQILNPSRDNMQYLNDLQQKSDPRTYAAQYMQEPLPSQYNLLTLEDISFYDTSPEQFDYYIQSWDTAIKVSEKADYSVCTTYGVCKDNLYLLHMLRKKLSYPELKQEAEKLMTRFNPKIVLIEDKASGSSLIQDLKNQGAFSSKIKQIKPKLDKLTRFASVLPMFQSGKILLPLKASFKLALLNELTSFPNSKHDDIVDSISQCLGYFKEQSTKPAVRIRII